MERLLRFLSPASVMNVIVAVPRRNNVGGGRFQDSKFEMEDPIGDRVEDRGGVEIWRSWSRRYW